VKLMNKIYFYQTEIGRIGIVENGEGITAVYFNESEIANKFELEETDLLREAAKQLQEYFSGTRSIFEIPIILEGTDFQKSVWKALQEIPYGETRSYGDIAKSIGNPKACRAVGMANNRNSIPVFIPCHRVIGSNGKLVGYAGGLEIKKHLLEIEKINANSYT
jgi:methylated-DNA-[protein]-cysteine S-methyltransferase